MVRCPHCGHEELPGSLFCTECGARLIARASAPIPRKGQGLGSVKQTPAPVREDETVPLDSPGVPVKAKASLLIMQNGEKLPLVGRAEFTLGRVSEGQPLIPEIDLSVYKAYDQGVSRLHAVLSIRTDQVSITDLGSANGTWLNGVRLPPHTAHTLKNGDLISLGTMKIQALIE